MFALQRAFLLLLLFLAGRSRGSEVIFRSTACAHVYVHAFCMAGETAAFFFL